jgi:8-oxo-dGTP pyrophosphatase MutT (NUDIX family)
MPSELHNKLLSAVSPFDQGVSALKLNVLRKSPDGDLSRPNRTAAVLVPVLDKPEPEVLLTVRSKSLVQHPGQVSFPGGAVDRSDRSAIATALREAEEEIGLDFSQVSPLGFLDRVDTISDYRVLPVVALIRPSFVWQPDHREVSEVFTVPLSLAVSRDAYTHQPVKYEDKTAVISSLHWQGHKIWGITAAILLNLGHRMEQTVIETEEFSSGSRNHIV